MKIAFAGNPNSGKTTLFNAVTGKVEKVGNWAGVTVDKKEGIIKSNLYKGDKTLTAIDLPGAYSMSPFTSEESVTSNFIKNENPDVIVNIVDATNLSRSLFFTTQLLELGIPVVVALNKSDLPKKKGITLDTDALSQKLSCPVVGTTATSKHGLETLLETVISLNGKSQTSPYDEGNVDKNDSLAVTEADKKRFDFVKTIVEDSEKRKQKSSSHNSQDMADRIFGHKWLGIPIFAAVMWMVFELSQVYIGPFFADGVTALPWFAEMEEVPFILQGLNTWMGTFQEWVGTLMADASPILSALVVDGIVGGFAAIVGFLPLIMVMFFLLALLEDCGYMARVAVVMDRFLKVVGLSGKSIIPVVIGTSCAIPGVMATRTIKNERQRRTTAMLAPFIPCGAKLPVIALIVGVFFPESDWVSPTMYFAGIVLIVLGALMVVRITGEKSARSFFIIELPEYRAPSFIRATIVMLSRAKSFVIKAGTIILLCNLIVHLMSTFTFDFKVVADLVDEACLAAGLPLASDAEAMMTATAAQLAEIRVITDQFQAQSILGVIASPFAILLAPLGFGKWQLAAAAITGFIAKENVVGTLSVVYGISNFISGDLELIGGATDVQGIMGIGAVAALAYLAFNLFTPPCFAAIGAMNSEMESKKWLWSGIALQFGTGYAVAFLVYQIGTLVTTGGVGEAFLPGLIVFAILVAIVIYLMAKGAKKEKAKLQARTA